MPKTETLDPKRAKPRSDRVEPKWVKSKIAIELPKRLCAKIEKADPTRT
jgi:hypothetical protein